MKINVFEKQHYIPKFLLHNFCDRSGKLYMYDRKNEKLFPTTARNAFTQRHIYTVSALKSMSPKESKKGYEITMERDYKYEQEFSQIESDVAPILEKMVESTRANGSIGITSDECTQLKRFLLGIDRRTPEAQQRQATGNKIPDHLLRPIAEMIKNHPDLANTRVQEECLISDLRRLMLGNISADFSAGYYSREKEKEGEDARKWGLSVAIITVKKRSFVIGSHGWSIFDNKTRWFPVARDVVVAGEPTNRQGRVYQFDQSDDQLIRDINYNSFRRSRFVVSDSEELLVALSKRCR